MMENTSTNSNTQHQNNDVIEQFKFTGKGSEYFGIWIVNILLTIVTLGIYSAWAKVRNKQYFYGNTYLNNSSFEYTADPINILKGRLIAVAALVAYQLSVGFAPTVGAVLIIIFTLLIPWFIMKSLAFNARYSQYRNIRFSFDQNAFNAYKVMMLIPLAGYLGIIILVAGLYFLMSGLGLSQSAGAMAFIGLLATIAIFAFIPYLMFIMARYSINNHNYGNSSFKLLLNNANVYYVIYLKLAGILLLGVVLFAIVMTLFSSISITSLASINPQDPAVLALLTPLLIFYVVAYAFTIAYVKARTYSAIYSNIEITNHRIIAKMSVRGLTLLYITNTLAIILTLGLFTPWAKVRTAKFKAHCTSLQVSGSLNEFINSQETHQNSLGEEIGEVFDLDIGL